jgi:hypothetical protein
MLKVGQRWRWAFVPEEPEFTVVAIEGKSVFVQYIAGISEGWFGTSCHSVGYVLDHAYRCMNGLEAAAERLHQKFN